MFELWVGKGREGSKETRKSLNLFSQTIFLTYNGVLISQEKCEI